MRSTVQDGTFDLKERLFLIVTFRVACSFSPSINKFDCTERSCTPRECACPNRRPCSSMYSRRGSIFDTYLHTLSNGICRHRRSWCCFAVPVLKQRPSGKANATFSRSTIIEGYHRKNANHGGVTSFCTTTPWR